VYTSGLMFIMRFFAGPLAHKLSPVGMLTVSAILSGAGLYWLSYVDNAALAFTAATVFGIGIAYFWPTMLGVTAERFPKGGALLLGLMGCFGNLAIWQALPQMGAIYDSYTVQKLFQEEPNSDKVQVETKDGKKVPLIQEGEGKTWVPPQVAEHIYPGGLAKKLNPDAAAAVGEVTKLKEAEKKGEKVTDAQKTWIADTEKYAPKVEAAEAYGAAWAFRWVAVLPAILVVVFGLIAIVDKLRGGYKAVHITDGHAAGKLPLKPGDTGYADYSRQ
jgi:hypothetical protein